MLRNVRRGEPIIVRSVRLDRPTLSLEVLEDGTANWDITKETPAREPESERPVRVSLRAFDVSDASISLDNLQTGLAASLTGFRQSLTGDFAEEVFTIQTRAHADSASLRFGGIPYLNRVALDVTADVGADMRTKKFTFAKNEIRLNDLILAFTGSAMVAEEP